MKKLFFTLAMFCAVTAQLSAQYCGNSGPSICSPAILTAPGLSPVSDSLAPLVDGVPTNTIIEFKNFDTLQFGGHTVTLQSLKIDSISNLPSGLCWATSDTNNTFQNQQSGCIRVQGTTTATPGQYKLNIVVDANIGFTVTTNADAAGLFYYVRVNCSDSVHSRPIDTVGQAEGTIPTFEAYDSACSTTYTSIKNIDQNVQGLSVYPNPFNNSAVVKFTSAFTGTMTERITTIIGSEVSARQISVVNGVNTQVVERKNLTAGIYFYTLSDGKSTFTKRLVITE